MPRLPTLTAACLALAAPAAAGQRLAALPVATSPVLAAEARAAAAAREPGAGARTAHAEPGRGAPLGRMPLRGVDPQTTGALPTPLPAPPAASRPPCPPGRRLGTGAGFFCVMN